MKKYSIYFCSTSYGFRPDRWTQYDFVYGRTKEEAIDVFMKKHGIPYISALDYFDISEVKTEVKA